MPEKSGPIKRFLGRFGPGLITGASDDDPSGIGTYSQAGAAYGYATLWTAVAMLPLMIVVQHLCAKIGMCSGEGLAAVLKKSYSRWLLYPAVAGLVIANTINAGADIAAISASINMFVPIPIAAMVVPIAVLIVALQIWGSYASIVKVFKWLTLTLFGYILAALLAKPDWGPVLRSTFVPQIRFDGAFITVLVALLGTTISPYLFFWQASQEVEEEKSMGRTTVEARKGATKKELQTEKTDTVAGMLLSNMVAYFVILAAASTLSSVGRTIFNRPRRRRSRECGGHTLRARDHRDGASRCAGTHRICGIWRRRDIWVENRTQRASRACVAVLRGYRCINSRRGRHYVYRRQSDQGTILVRCYQRRGRTPAARPRDDRFE
jgi:NRAMP (natural resistance-associated macrophage protein)-like metal ion transporter